MLEEDGGFKDRDGEGAVQNGRAMMPVGVAGHQHMAAWDNPAAAKCCHWGWV